MVNSRTLCFDDVVFFNYNGSIPIYKLLALKYHETIYKEDYVVDHEKQERDLMNNLISEDFGGVFYHE